MDNNSEISKNFSENEEVNEEINKDKNLTINYSEQIPILAKSIITGFLAISDFVNKTRENFKAIGSAISTIHKNITNALINIDFKGLSEKFKKNALNNVMIWAQFGWTCHPELSINFFADYTPKDKNDADKQMLSFCKKENMSFIFEQTLNTKGVKKSDYNEAIFDFNNAKYKSCALILSALIDSKFIRLQKIKGTDAWRKVDKKAIDKINKQVMSNEENYIFWDLLLYKNLFECLDKIFENGDDFKVQPEVVNRNFIAHGMFTGRVRKKDCIQLFLLYLNTLNMINELFRKDKNYGQE